MKTTVKASQPADPTRSLFHEKTYTTAQLSGLGLHHMADKGRYSAFGHNGSRVIMKRVDGGWQLYKGGGYERYYIAQNSLPNSSSHLAISIK